MNRSALLAAAAAFLLLFPLPSSLFPLSAFAEPQPGERTITFRDQDIYTKGLSGEIWIGEKTSPTAQLVLIYSNATEGAVNTFRTEGLTFKAEMLLVGGGGSGGSNSTRASNAGGGGGGGQVVSLDETGYSAGTYTITVGAGGAQAAAGKIGNDGSPSSVVFGGTTISALGGGGGGYNSAGKGDGTVGTGGGGSGANKAGGVGALGEDHRGGNAASVANYAGGGGGAGGAGSNGVNTVSAGAGGLGVTSRITGVAQDFGGGGGGGNAGGTNPGAGVAGGGQGGTSGSHGVAGTDGSGGGGGGGGSSINGNLGGAGGSGIVIIRLTFIEQPIVWQEIPLFGDGKIFIDQRAAWSRVDPSDLHSDIIIAYSNVAASGGLRFFNPDDGSLPPVWATARILAVGGGGGGGFIDRQTAGGGAGGGAGGFVETGLDGKLIFDSTSEYSITVGAGGPGGKTYETAGTKGDDSLVEIKGGASLVKAYGGGGGGAHSAGGNGGSGGGGSRAPNDRGGVQDGGIGTSGQGFNGGTGSDLIMGGGGGGAGGAGGSSSELYGGIGKMSDITGSRVWYAGGGGGAFVNSTNPDATKSPGGAGGSFDEKAGRPVGGNGAGNATDGKTLSPVAAQDGMDGRGGGGGGGTSHVDSTTRAGNGGNGVVIIRLSGFVVKNIPLPKPSYLPGQPFTYDGNVHTGVVEFFAYTLSGTPVATNSDVYSVTATMAPGSPYYWADWHEGDPEEKKWGDRTVTWRINQLRVPQPAAVSSLVYNGEEQYPVDKEKLHLDDDGYCYTDEGLKYCFLTATHKATNATAYHFSAQLVKIDPQGNFATNFVWSNNSSMDDRPYDWEITQAANRIIWTAPYLGYLRSRLDTPAKAHHPTKHFACDWGKGTAKIEYRPVESGGGTPPPPEEGWQEWPPAEKGSYTLRITVEETPNWQGDSVTTDFGTWDNLADIYSDQMVVTAEGYNGGTANTLYDFPVPVRVHEPAKDGYEPFSGFSYARAGATGKELHFFDSNGDPIEHEVDTWNTHGESVLWVRLPELKGNGTAGKTDGTAKGTTTLTMCWRRVSDIRLPAYDPEAVWRKNYAGVWHFSQEEGGVWADSTGNERHAHLSTGGKVRAIDGPMGKALYVQSGDLLADDWPYKPGTLTNRFTYSGWYRYPDFVAEAKEDNNKSPVPAGSRIFAGLRYDATSINNAKTLPGWALRMVNKPTYVSFMTTTQDWGWDWGTSKWNVQTTWGYTGLRTGHATPTATAGAGVSRYYAYDLTFNRGDTTGIGYFVNGGDNPLQLAATGFEVDEVRFSTNTLSNVWIEQEYRTLYNKDYCTYGLIKIDCDRYNSGNGLICDYWTTVPSLSKTVWREGETWPTESKGAYKGAGSAVTAKYQLIPGGEPTTAHPTAKGHYRATYDHSVPLTYRAQAHTIDFYIIEATVPVYDIGGNGGDSGRILLMNADNKTKTMQGETYSCTVTNQGWCATSDAGVTWWRTLSASAGTNNVMPGTEFDLVRSVDTNVLWHLADCRQGNLFPTNDTAGLSANLCYLPASSATALSITNESVAATRSGTGWVLMRNIAGSTDDDGGACVYSPCYSNGIGTIYFDAVNSLKAQGDRAEAFKLVLEVVTENDTGEPPYDENSYWEDGAGYTNRYGRLTGHWRLVEMSPTLIHTSTYTDQTATNCLALKETTAGRQDYFYRVHALVDVHKPCRFRIRRVSRDETVPGPDGQPDPDDSYILLDNIIASFPPVVAELTPYGSFDATLDGARAVGYGGAFETPFPSAAEGASLTGRCAVAFTDGYTPSAESFTLKQMFYRWRYLEQLKEPTDGDWAATDLTEAGDELRTAQPLETPAEAGDIEFYFVTVLKAPYYGYVDYSGNRPVSKAGYTEEGLPHESRFKSSDGRRLASGGTDWFVRLRDARSRYEGVLLLTRPADGGPVETNVFELAGDDQWTAKLRTRNPVRGGLDFRIEGLNPQTPGAREYAFSTDRWKTDNRIETFPSREGLSVCGADDWGWVACDGATGFLYFQLDLDKKAVQIAHAQAEDFSKWSSAINENGLFVGSAVDTNASSAVTVEYDANMAGWAASVATNGSWQLSFGAPGQVAAVVYPRYEPFSSKYVNGWTAENAMWTYGKWSLQNAADPMTSTGDDSALQLEGRGYGRLSFTEAAKSPDGLDTVSYAARVAQYNEYDNFTYYNTWIPKLSPTGAYEGGQMSLDMSDYTFATCAALTAAPGGKDLYDGDGSVSLVAYYNPQFGAYEFRVSRSWSDRGVRLALFRWRLDGGAMVCEKLLDANSTASKRKNYFDLGDETDATKRNAANIQRLIKESPNGSLGGLFISVKEKDGASLVTAGIRKADVSASMGMESQDNQEYATIVYKDKSASRLTRGTFGVLSCNCPGVFVKPLFWKDGVESVTPSKDDVLELKDGQTIDFTGDQEISEVRKPGNWIVRPGRTEQLASTQGHFGFQAAPVLPQKIVVQVAESGTADWRDVYTNTVNGFTRTFYPNVVRDPRKCSVRLQSLGKPSDVRADVVIDDIELTQWNGQWTEHWNESAAPWRNLTNAFVYTSAWVLDRSGRKSLNLQPTRAQTASTPVSLRSPLMRGLGLVHFAWRNADPHAKVRVQYKENASYVSLPDATKTLSSGETEIGDGWVDWKDENGNAVIDIGAIGESGSMSVYLNRRYDKTGSDRNYLFGLIRVVIDEDVQAEAMAKRRTDPRYGAVEITDMFTWDFPEYDKDGWQGWNFRAAGWNGTDPDAFANLKDGFRGLSGLLNNTLDPDTLADREKDHYSQRSPSVQSPAFRTNCVGALSFRARLYDADDQRLSGHPAVVSVYGCNDFDPKSGEPRGDWNWICDVEVSNRTYAIQSVKIPATLDCKAIRLAVKGVKGVTSAGTPVYEPILRVALDDICIWERLSQSVAFRKAYVRPFRDATAIKGKEVVPDIAERTEQPLVGESFGFQAEVDVLDPDEVITGDPEHPVTVDLWYYAPKPGEPAVWGFENWKNSPSAVKVPVLAEATGRGDRLIFRSTVEQSASLCPPQFLEKGEGYRIVQYHVTAHYFVQGYSEGVHELQSSEWSMPEWNTGFTDPNATNTAFSAFTLLEEIAPGRAWINEINYCEPTKDKSLANQWIELAVPSGVDMTGWSVDVYNYEGNWVSKLVTLGLKDAPASKRYGGTDPIALASHYAFYTVKSPDTTAIAADATWPRFGGTGSFAYTEPYAFELKRPTGVVEHRVVAQGYNDVKGKKWYWTDYEGTNLVEVMRRKDGSAWTWSAEDLHDASAENCSVSVVTNQGFVHEDWVSPLKMTPGDINRGQYIDPNWYILPNGGYVKIYSSVLSTALGTHMRQIIGGVTNLAGDLTVSQGTSTSIVYEVDRWYKLGERSVDPDERAHWSGPQPPGADGKLYYRLDLNQVSNSITVTVSADVSDEVTELIDEKNREKYAAYVPAIMKWLTDGETGWDDAGHHRFMNPNGPLKVGYYRGHRLDNPLPDGEDNRLDLLHLYWFDLDPTSGGWELWGGMGARPGSAAELPVDDTVLRTKQLYGGGEFVHTNHLTSFWMELRNNVLNAPAGLSYPPYRLQGLGNERSDGWGGVWTSATFKVTMCLNNGKVNWQFHPMRYFVFGWGSFHSPKDPETTTPYSAVVEITDPFSDQSPAAEWGWKKYESEDMRENGLFTRWRIDGAITPGGVSTLKKNDLLEF